MYALAIFIFLTAVLVGVPQVLQVNNATQIAYLRSEARAENLRTYHSGGVDYAMANAGFTGSVPNANVLANLPSWYVPNGAALWFTQVRTYGTQRMVVTHGQIGGSGAESVQRRTKSMACGMVTGGAVVAPRPNGTGIVSVGPSSTPSVNFNLAPYSITDGNFACLKLIN